MTITFLVLFRGEKKIWSFVISTRFSSWNRGNEYLSRCKMASWRTLDILGIVKLLSARVYVFLLFHCCTRPWILKICLVEAAHNKNSNDSICTYLRSWISTFLQKWLRLSNGTCIFHCCKCHTFLYPIR